jgi:flagellar basal body rod protein FlgG
MSLLEVAAATLSGAERRIEIAARNVANAGTPGYKREVAFTELAVAPNGTISPAVRSTRMQEQGVLVESGNPLDLAVNGAAFLLVRDGDRFLPTRGGSFTMGEDGLVVDALGRVLQQAGGGDLAIERGDPVVELDGTVLVDDAASGAIGLYDGAALEGLDPTVGLTGRQAGTLAESETAELRQGMVERSNVAIADEIVGLMQTQRQGEAAAQIIRTYDQLIGQAATTFGKGGQ